MSDETEKTKVELLREAFQRVDADLADGKAAPPADLGLLLRALVEGVTEGLDQLADVDVRGIVREELDAREQATVVPADVTPAALAKTAPKK